MELFIILGFIFCFMGKDRSMKRHDKAIAATRAKYGITKDDYDL